MALVAARQEADQSLIDAERQARQEELRHAATHDALTGALNRAGLYERLGTALPTAAPDHGVAALYVDLDRFKPVNDRHGHATGDRLLAVAAQRLKRVLRPQDALARVGGDEFVAVLVGVGANADVRAVAARAAAALHEPFNLDGTVVAVSASLGHALTHDPATTADELLGEADREMYAAKGRAPAARPLADGPRR
ncbi:GGDEF domain-containing protein [Motilibacter sp. K478]|nr:GGDEF domain-containing protein [Motilibacter aurantiacus]NHC46658.1 GGDEF domain-containing protein [Motilibacter aurantiacus]